MNLQTLQKEKITAMKNKDEIRKQTISEMIDAIQKASITPKGRIEITDSLVDEVLIKYQKMVQEMIDTCPKDRVETIENYNTIMTIVKEFAPQLMTDPIAIKEIVIEKVRAAGLELDKSSRGPIMKLVSAEFKGKADMKIVSSVVNELLK
jgi:uncharacterized protein YqeY